MSQIGLVKVYVAVLNILLCIFKCPFKKNNFILSAFVLIVFVFELKFVSRTILLNIPELM